MSIQDASNASSSNDSSGNDPSVNDPSVNPSSGEPPFAQFLGIREGLGADGVGTASMVIQDKHLQRAGVVQGGLIVTLADNALFLAVQSRLNPGERNVTIELKMNFIAPAKEGELTATARVISLGGRIVVAGMEVTDHNDTLIATGLGTCMRVRPR